jgi:UDP-2,4-diacetamido-2,4,6-trideoxy-beta-L-altropyranose hydrolase
MRLLIRPDVGPDVGLGHLRLCLNVAEALRGAGVESVFVLPPGIRAEGFRVEESIGTGPLLVDSYRLGEAELDRLAAERPLALFDDRCLHPFSARLVINGGLGAETRPYLSSSGDTEFLLGARYSPLRSAYWNGPPARPEPGDVPCVLVVFGGADLTGSTPAAVAALDSVAGPLRIVAAIGPLAGTLDETREKAALSPHDVEVVQDPPDFTALVTGADLAVTDGGGTLVELVAAGTPSIAIEIADNQRPGIEALAAAGAAVPGDESRIAPLVEELLADAPRRALLGQRGPELLDGRGALRIAERLSLLAE